MLIRLVVSLLAAFAFTTGAAEAATLSVSPSIEGGGVLTSGSQTCQSTAGATATTITECPAASAANDAGEAELVVTAMGRPGWMFSGWSGCPEADGPECEIATGAFVHAEAEVRAKFVRIGPAESIVDLTATATETLGRFAMTWSVEVAGASFRCSLDGAPATPCSSGVTVDVGVGSHEFKVEAISFSNAVTATASVRFAETRSPDTKISRTAGGFELTSNQAVNGFACTLDGAFYPCSATFSPAVGPGKHKLTAAALNTIGLFDPTPASYSWVA